MNENITIVLKNDIRLSGVLVNVDPYLNFKLKDIKVLSGHIGLDDIDLCSIRGYGIRYLVLDKDEDTNPLNEATRLCLTTPSS